MHKKSPKICTGCRVSAAKIYLYHGTEIAKARPHSEEWQTDTSVQKHWSMAQYILGQYALSTCSLLCITGLNCFVAHLGRATCTVCITQFLPKTCHEGII